MEFLVGNTGKDQLYYKEQLYHSTSVKIDSSKCYWVCIHQGCRTSLTTTNGIVTREPAVQHTDHESISHNDFICRGALQRIKRRVQHEVHVDPSIIFDDEIEKMQLAHGITPVAISHFINPYQRYKNSYYKMRAKCKPALNDFDNFDDQVKKVFTVTVGNKPFLRFDNQLEGSRILIFVSDHGLGVLGKATRWHSDGTFFSAPKPFMQVYLVHGYDQADNMIPCAYTLLQKKDRNTYIEMLYEFKKIGDSVHIDLIISNPPSKRANVSDDHVDPRWLTGDQIDVFLRTACKSKNQYRLTFAAASSLVFDGECRVGRTLLGRYRFVHGPVHSGKPRHLTTLFIDIDERRFIYINSLGTTQQATDDAFSNWLNYVAKRPDLKQLHEEKPFVNVVVDHPVQVDSYNCGAFVCKFILMLLNDEIINSNSFEPASMDSFRATILSDSM